MPVQGPLDRAALATLAPHKGAYTNGIPTDSFDCDGIYNEKYDV